MTNKLTHNWAVLALGALMIASCSKDEDVTVETEDYKGIFVINEGGFNKANGSVGLYKPGTKSYFDAFKKANDRPLGDVVQSMSLINDKFYIVVNNSNKVEVVGKSDFKSSSTLMANSPRYLLKVGDNKAFLSNLYSNTVKILDLSSNSFTGSVDIHHWSDALATMNSKTYVATSDGKIMMIDNNSNALIDSIVTPSGLSKIVNAGAEKIGVLCTGSVDWNTGSILENGHILILSKDSNTITKSVELSTGSYGGAMVYDPSSAAFYFSLGNATIQKMTLDGTITTFVTLPVGNSVYGLTMDNSGNLYVTDAMDYNSAGKVFVYDSSGTKTNEFSAGIVPNAILIN